MKIRNLVAVIVGLLVAVAIQYWTFNMGRFTECCDPTSPNKQVFLRYVLSLAIPLYALGPGLAAGCVARSRPILVGCVVGALTPFLQFVLGPLSPLGAVPLQLLFTSQIGAYLSNSFINALFCGCGAAAAFMLRSNKTIERTR